MLMTQLFYYGVKNAALFTFGFLLYIELTYSQ